MTEQGHKGLTTTCKAKIKGGWKRNYNDIGNYGIALDLPYDFIEGFEGETVYADVDRTNTNTVTVSTATSANIRCLIQRVG